MAKRKLKQVKAPSAKKWREFEKLVTRIEAFLGPKGIIVTSPDHVHDVVTGSDREVDASLRYQVGSSPVLITIECRDHQDVQDVLWIEQLVTKQRDVKAALCVAVSSSGFTKAAIAKAKHYGIEIRLVHEVTDSELLSWFQNVFIEMKYRTVTVREIKMLLETDDNKLGIQLADDLAAAFLANAHDARIFFDRDSANWISVQYIPDDWQKQGGILEDDAIPFGQMYRKSIGVRAEPAMYTRTNQGQYDISYLDIGLDVTCFKERVLLTDFLQYSDDTRSPKAYCAQGKFVIQGHDCCTVYVHRSADPHTVPRITVEPHDTEFFGRGKALGS